MSSDSRQRWQWIQGIGFHHEAEATILALLHAGEIITRKSAHVGELAGADATYTILGRVFSDRDDPVERPWLEALTQLEGAREVEWVDISDATDLDYHQSLLREAKAASNVE